MHRAAELGVAAHWQYKEKRNYDEDLDRSTRILRDLIERGQDEEAQSPLFSDRVFAFTPNDDIIELPRGATVLDFAYRIHSQIGNRCRGAKVNGAIVSLKYPVKNGDRIEILANKNATPSPAWMDRKEGYLKTSHALSRVRNWFNTRDLDGRLASGQQILDRELQRLEARDLSVEKLARKLHFNRLSEMLLALESGEVGPDRLANVVDQILRPSAIQADSADTGKKQTKPHPATAVSAPKASATSKPSLLPVASPSRRLPLSATSRARKKFPSTGKIAPTSSAISGARPIKTSAFSMSNGTADKPVEAGKPPV